MSTGAYKLWLMAGGIILFAIGKFIYDYTKLGKEAEAKKE
jgi:hypothetical protein